ncbi:NAD(P)-binding protein [Dongshaea marina]|uniref:NAD(P)-binding protein n=1 Tax=Dongshaea marina TaxID=2047966 RepID=UPI000D3E47CB|nr:NAD(P)-binding protein [Dongshaea marina]
MSNRPYDMTQPPDLSIKRGPGPIQGKIPVYVDSLPPCNEACPAGSNIQAWLSLAQEERFEEAWQELMRNNPMPAIHGRICYHPCEDSCNRTQVDGAVSIHAVERFLGDEALKQGWQMPVSAKPSGKRVLVIGAGPSGLSAAYQLRMQGHEVEVHDEGPMAGGMMHYGIPSYRLPREILQGEIERIEKMGVTFVPNHRVEDVLAEKIEGKFDAVFIAIGAHIGKQVEIPAENAGKVIEAVSYLRDIELKQAPKLGPRIAVYGGGNTAMDAARTAKRMGASEVMVIYRRDREHMPAHDFEASEAIEEGIVFHWLRTIKSIDETTFTLEKMVIENHKPKPTGELTTVEADSLILALGQESDAELLKGIPGIEHEWDTVKVNSQMMTGYQGIFAGGDMVPCDRTVTTAVGHGKKAARCIDAFLRGSVYQKPAKHPLIPYEKLQLWYKTDAEQSEQPQLSLEKRKTTFEEVVGGLSEPEAVYEAMRCYSCGNCFECHGCLAACPETALSYAGQGQGYKLDINKCTGCSACSLQCPCHAIEMVKTGNGQEGDSCQTK